MLLGLLVMAALSYISSLLPDFYKLSLALERPKEIDDAHVSRIAYGTPASIKDHPYFVDLDWCGGSIISDQWVLTAAHCVGPLSKPEEQLKYVSVGSDNNKNKKMVKIEEIIVHPLYVEDLLVNDIALIKLAETLKFNDKIQPINLPREYEAFQPGSSGVFIGMGNDENKKMTENLMKMEVKIYPKEHCKRKRHPKPYTSSWLFDSLKSILGDTELCAVRKGGVPGASHGDSGSPLVQGNILRGLASYGIRISPDILYLTNVAYYVRWINFVTKGNVNYKNWSEESEEIYFEEWGSDESEESASEESEESASDESEESASEESEESASEEREESASEESKESASEESEESASEESEESASEESEESASEESEELSLEESDKWSLEEAKEQPKRIPLPYYYTENQRSVKQMELTTGKSRNLPKHGKQNDFGGHVNMPIL